MTMVRFRLLQRYLAAPMGELLLLAAIAGCSSADDDSELPIANSQ
jgi:hypothetical protein